MRRDGVQARRLGGGQQRVASVSGLPPAWAATAELHVEFGGGHKVVSTADDGTCRHAGPDMDRREIIHVINRRRPPSRGAAGTSSAGWKISLMTPLSWAAYLSMRQPQPDGGMAVMAAGVHHAGVAGGEMIAMGAVAIVMLFVEIEGIHIDAKGRGWPGPPGVERGTTPAKPPSTRQPALRRALFAGAFESPGEVSRPAAPSGCRHR